MVIRWLGAFKKKSSLKKSLNWELSQTTVKALAAERLVKGKSAIHKPKIGLLVKNSAMLRKFNSDVFSVYRNDKLVKTRKEGKALSFHTECWVKPVFIAIVVKRRVSKQALQACKETSEKFNLDLLKLTREGRLVAFK